ncbi:hypothetical protein L1887_14651 [Cichorium endivia]|nr:hypothetical protein L1887_14651 [Cichorium endivia]
MVFEAEARVSVGREGGGSWEEGNEVARRGRWWWSEATYKATGVVLNSGVFDVGGGFTLFSSFLLSLPHSLPEVLWFRLLSTIVSSLPANLLQLDTSTTNKKKEKLNALLSSRSCYGKILIHPPDIYANKVSL